MKTVAIAALMLALLTAPTYSQGKGGDDGKAEEQKRRAQEIERDYRP